MRNVARLKEYSKLIRDKYLWGKFPSDMRAYFLAQRATCPYCGKVMHPLPAANGPRADVDRRARINRDHVFPKHPRRKGASDILVIAHLGCNQTKNDRVPFPCEVLYAEFTREIVENIYSYLE